MTSVTWTIRSSDTGKEYTLTRHYDGFVECDCPDYVYRKRQRKLTCKHIDEWYEANVPDEWRAV
jgi:hypothetical protein